MSNFYKRVISNDQIINEITTTLPSGVKQKWLEVDLPFSILEDDKNNIRFGGELLSPKDHKDKLLKESPKEFENLKRSMSAIPQSSEAIIAYLNPGMKNPIKIHGHRRTLAAAEIDLSMVRVLVAIDITDETKKFLRDNPEANPTKVNHTPYAKARMAHNELKGIVDSNKREKVIGEICKRTGYTKAKVLGLEGASQFMDDVCSDLKINPDSRKSQFKSFETCYKVNKGPFQELRIKGDFNRFDSLETLMKSFLKFGVAHDDINVSLNYLSKAKASDPTLQEIINKEVDIDDIEDLRKITVNVRLAQIKADSPVKEVKKACDREWQRTFELQDKKVASDVVEELSLIIQKFESLRDSMV